MRCIVVKFGGASLKNGERIRKGANAVYREYKKGTRVAVVVSAIGDTTDELIEVAKVCTDGKITSSEMDDVMAMGERTSARVFASALKSLGADALYLDPSQETWPIITNDNFGQAEVDLVKTSRLVRKNVLPLLKKGKIPVICGFLGRDEKGRITTIGRGGSDITAFILGKCLGADEVIIITDTEGVMSGDPQRVGGARVLDRIQAEEMRDLASYGAKKLHPRALDYKDEKIDAKIIHFRHGDLSARGTKITGPRSGGSKASVYKKPLSMLTIIGERLQTAPGILESAVKPLSRAKINIFGVSIGPRTFSLYVSERDEQRALELLHKVVKGHRLMKSVTSESNIALIVAESKRFIDTPGMIAALTGPLAKEGINIVEILSSRSSISFFVNWEDRERALELVRQVMKKVGA